MQHTCDHTVLAGTFPHTPQVTALPVDIWEQVLLNLVSPLGLTLPDLGILIEVPSLLSSVCHQHLRQSTVRVITLDMWQQEAGFGCCRSCLPAAAVDTAECCRSQPLAASYLWRLKESSPQVEA